MGEDLTYSLHSMVQQPAPAPKSPLRDVYHLSSLVARGNLQGSLIPKAVTEAPCLGAS